MTSKSTFALQLDHFIDAVLAANQHINLTSVREPQLARIKHLDDSLMGLQTGLFEGAKKVIDIGAGAGFPGVPLALARPQLQLSSLDSTAKKCAFLQEYVDQQNLAERIKVLLGRAETWAQDGACRERFDIALTRAVGSFSEVCELTLPFVKPKGHVVLWRGKDAAVEVEKTQKVLFMLGAKLVNCVPYQLPQHEMEYNLVVLGKVKKTPAKYPRRVGLPKKSPL